MHSPAPAPAAPTITRKGHPWLRWVGLAFLVLLVLLVAAAFIGYFKSYDLAKSWVQSPKGQRAASQGLGKAIKVDGQFAPLHLQGWTIQTDSFKGPGWPGEALSGIEADNIRAEFDPSAIFHHAWRISGIQVDRATIQLQPPNDKLKRPVPPKKPKPWYAFLLPDHFECGPIVAQNAVLEFSFQKHSARIHDAHVQADLIGKDLKYTATSGVLEFPYLPPMRIHRLEMLVTRPLITIYTAQLAGMDPNDPARISLSGKLGMRDNKAIDAHLEIVQIPIEQLLPENLQPLIHGRASGKLVWTRDATGQQVSSDGDLTITDGRIDDLSVFRQLVMLHDNPDLKDFSFDQATCHFHLENGVCTIQVQARSPDKFDLNGTVNYTLTSKVADLNIGFSNLPVKTWVPTDFKPDAAGMAQASLKWQGQLNTIKNSSGTVLINLDGAQVSMPAILRRALAPKHLRAPDEVRFQKAELKVDYQDKTFHLTQGDLVLPGILNAQLSGSLTADTALNAIIDWQGLTIQDWLPPELADQFQGDINGHATVKVSKWKLADGSYAGEVTLLHGELRYTSVQSMLARFTNDRRLLNIPLTHAHFFWAWDNGALSVTDIDLRGDNNLAVTGTLRMKPDKKLSGLLWIGTRPEYLKSLGGAGEAVFARHQDGLIWAKVTVSGTTRKLQQDLTAQVLTQLKKRPFVVLGLGFKLASWYVGDLFGAQDAWTRPVGAAPSHATIKAEAP